MGRGRSDQAGQSGGQGSRCGARATTTKIRGCAKALIGLKISAMCNPLLFGSAIMLKVSYARTLV